MILMCSDDDLSEANDTLCGVAHCKSGVVCYSDGLEKFKESGGQCSDITLGRFFISYKEDDDWVIRSDEDGNELIFYYSSEEFWCLSTSFLGLSWYLSDRGFKLTASKLELAKMFVHTSLFEQPFNENLPIKEIKLLRINDEIRISNNKFKVVERTPKTKDGDLLFYDRVNEFIRESRAVIEGYLQSFDVDLELSGGVDSRIVLGLALPYAEKLNVTSDKGRIDDYMIARVLADNYQLKINSVKRSNSGNEDAEKKWMLYKLGNVGISRTNPAPNQASGTEFSKSVRLNGGGAGVSKVFYNPNSKAYLNLIERSNLSLTTKEKVKDDLLDSLASFGYHSLPLEAMTSIYSSYRKRFFAGRAWYYSLLGIIYAPMSGELFKSLLEAPDIKQVFGVEKEECIERNLIALFLLYVLDPVLPFIRFDEKKKDFDISDIRLIKDAAKKFEMVDHSAKGKVLCYGGVMHGEALPNSLKDSIEKFRYDACCDSYDDFLYEDISDIVSDLRNLDFLNDKYLDDLESKVVSKSLNKQEKLSCLHVSEILKSSAFISD